MEKRKVYIVLEVLSEVYATFPNTKDFIEKKLEETCSREKISVEKVFYFVDVSPYRLCKLVFLLFFNIKNSCF